MTDKTENGMTMSADTKAVLLAVQARISSIPAGETLIDSITEQDWADPDVASWMVNVGSDAAGNSEELDLSDKEAVHVA